MTDSESTKSWPDHYLMVFVGHADDALEHAEYIERLEGHLQHELNLRLEAIREDHPLKVVSIYRWGVAAPRVTGGQALIDRVIDRANMGVFIFKNKVGKVSWQELERFRVRRSNTVPIVIAFPENIPSHEVLMNEEGSAEWAELLSRKRHQTAVGQVQPFGYINDSSNLQVRSDSNSCRTGQSPEQIY